MTLQATSRSRLLLICCVLAVRSADASELRLDALESAPVLIVGELHEVAALPYAGWTATLVAERALRGEVARGQALQLAWEERAPSLPARWDSGSRVLMAVGPGPTASIWKTRVPEAEARAVLLGPDLNGVLERPSVSELLALEHYLALPADERDGPGGLVHLARMTAEMGPELARASVDRLRAHPGLGGSWPPGTAESLVRALTRSETGDAPDALLALLSDATPEAIVPALVAAIRATQPAPPPILHEALGAARGGLPAELSESLLASASPAQRRAAARFATGERARSALRKLSLGDPDPEVRARALSRLLSIEGEAALELALRAFEDPEPAPRRAAVYGVARLGGETVTELERFALARSSDAARSAVAALSLMGDAARPALTRIADEHEDKGLRALAGIAIGQPIGHAH